MISIRIHGRGGQGVVTAAELLALAAFDEGRHAQAFPSFGSERTGAPVVSFCRIDDHEIRLREPIAEPDALVIADPTLLHQVDVFSGLRPDGYLLINSGQDLSALGLTEFASRFRRERMLTVPATDLAREHLGRPMPNAVLLGGLAAISGFVTLAGVHAAIRETFAGDLGERNVRGATAAHDWVRAELDELSTPEGLTDAATG